MRLTNYYEHPADNRYYVFRFAEGEYADEFEAMLNESKIRYERYRDTDGPSPVILFGVHKSLFKEALRCNYLIYGKHREPFISHPLLRWALLIVTAGMIALAVAGYLLKK